MTSGLQKGELIIIAARPSMGKTALAINIAQNAAITSKATVAVFSLEMSKESLLRRMLASQARVDQRKLQTGFLGREDQASCSMRWSNWSKRSIFIDDSAGISLAEMRAKARRLKQNTGGLDLVVVDYLQLMSATLPSAGGKRYENRTQEVVGDFARAEGAGQGAERAGDCAVAAFACQRAARRRQAADAERSARVGLD